MSGRAEISVLIVDDSSLARRSLRLVLSEAGFSVIGEASSGAEGVELAERLAPRVITMDLFMPGMNGLEAIAEIMARAPTRILVVTSTTEIAGRDATFESLSRGALELLPKPTAWPATAAERELIVQGVERIAELPVVPHLRAAQQQRAVAREARRERQQRPLRLVVIGGSTGAPGVLKDILQALPTSFPVPIVAVQHLSAVFAQNFVAWLDEVVPLRVCEAVVGQRLEPGVAYVAARPPHTTVTANGEISCSSEPPRGVHNPAVDVLFESAATAFGGAVAGLLLTGMGRDGAAGLKRIYDAGGLTLAQNEASSAVFGMPAAARELGAVRELLPPPELAAALLRAVGLGGAK